MKQNSIQTIKTISWLVIISLLINFFSHSFINPKLAQAYTAPVLPLASANFTISVTGKTISVPAGGDLQAAINSASLGDEIVLQAGTTYLGNFTLPNKTTGSGGITIRTSNLAGIPAQGVRVTPANASAMPKIITNNLAPAISAMYGAHDYRFLGIEMATNSQSNYSVVLLGDDGLNTNHPASSLSQLPNHIEFDRVYIHGTVTGENYQGIMANANYLAVKNSYINEFHSGAFDAQAITIFNAQGPFLIDNNFLEAAGENILFGGAGAVLIPNIVPSDVTFTHNYLTKPTRWQFGSPDFAGTVWVAKNVFELKNAQRVLVEGNVLERSWIDTSGMQKSQDGSVIVLTPRNQLPADSPWSKVQDVTIRNNIIRYGELVVNFQGWDNGQPSEQGKNILLQNNLAYNINGVFKMQRSPANVYFDHNTMVGSETQGSLGYVGGTGSNASGVFMPTPAGQPEVVSGFVFQNNLVKHGNYGLIGDSVGEGNAAFATFFPGYIFSKNVMGGPDYSSGYPVTNFFPSYASFDSSFTSISTANYQLVSSSPYKLAGTDGKDIGSDITTLNAATAGVIAGNPSGGNTPPPPPPTPVAGDLNLDHIVNSLDWSIMNSKWFTTDANADLNHDGLVNAIDFSILNANWFKTW